MLSEEDRAHFRLFGYLVLPSLLTTGEMRRVADEIEHALQVLYDGEWPEDRTSRNINAATPLTPFLSTLLDDPRFVDVAEFVLEAPVVPWGVEANSFLGDTLGHVDLPEAVIGIPACKFVMYVDPVGADSGALKFIPGSHRLPLRDELFAHSPAHEGTTFVGGDSEMNAPFIACETEPGDVVLFSEAIWHATTGGGADRRMATVIYHSVPNDASDLVALAKWMTYALDRLTEADWARRTTRPRGKELFARIENLVELSATQT